MVHSKKYILHCDLEYTKEKFYEIPLLNVPLPKTFYILFFKKILVVIPTLNSRLTDGSWSAV